MKTSQLPVGTVPKATDLLMVVQDGVSKQVTRNIFFGGDTDGTFVPSIGFDTPGDLSIAYAARVGFFRRVGDLVFFSVEVQFTPTYTTAAASFYIGGLPASILAGGTFADVHMVNRSASVGLPATATEIIGDVEANRLYLSGMLSGKFVATLSVAEFASGVEHFVKMTGTFIAEPLV